VLLARRERRFSRNGGDVDDILRSSDNTSSWRLGFLKPKAMSTTMQPLQTSTPLVLVDERLTSRAAALEVCMSGPHFQY
jgi:hypothetical protein